jgi:hypothetical protein
MINDSHILAERQYSDSDFYNRKAKQVRLLAQRDHTNVMTANPNKPTGDSSKSLIAVSI